MLSGDAIVRLHNELTSAWHTQPDVTAGSATGSAFRRAWMARAASAGAFAGEYLPDKHTRVAADA